LADRAIALILPAVYRIVASDASHTLASTRSCVERTR
jgi:hypothetical protein